MKSLKIRNAIKAIAFFLIAAIITCTVAFAAGDWQSPQQEPDSGNADNDHILDNGETDENTDGDKNKPTDSENKHPDVSVGDPVPEYIDYITGLEITREESKDAPFSFIYDTKSSLYGISSAQMVIEVPTEDGNTRLIALTRNPYDLGKIGGIAPTRNYFSSLISYFGGIAVSYGFDDKFEYTEASTATTLDLSEASGYSYTEYTDYVCTNGDLIEAYIRNQGISTKATSVVMPFKFCEYGSKYELVGNNATTVTVPYSGDNSSLFTYSRTDGKYTLSKNGILAKDKLNDSELKYDNLFILFSNAATYETADATQTIIDTSSGGAGYYISGGRVINISWSVDGSGNLIFIDSSGERLTVNRGSSYISIVKASKKSSVIIA